MDLNLISQENLQNMHSFEHDRCYNAWTDWWLEATTGHEEEAGFVATELHSRPSDYGLCFKGGERLNPLRKAYEAENVVRFTKAYDYDPFELALEHFEGAEILRFDTDEEGGE